jgi:subtilisin
MSHPAPDAPSDLDDLPAWSAAFDGVATVRALPLADVREWAFGGATGAGVRVAVVDSGVDATHPAVGAVARSVAVRRDPDPPEGDDGIRFEEGPHDDLVGHGTACAGIVRLFAPEAELWSVRVLGANLKGQGALLVAGVDWAVEQGAEVLNLSLSSKSRAMYATLHEVADDAYFAGSTLVCAANNVPGPTYPSQFASVVSVAARPGDDPWALACNPRPPVEFGARGIDVEVPWSGDGESSIVATGNSFAAPHVTGMVAAMRGKHPWLAPYQVKAVLQAVSVNATTSASWGESA